MTIKKRIFEKLFFFALYIRGENYTKYTKEYSNNQYLPLKNQKLNQLIRLNELLAIAQDIPHYGNRIPTSLNSLESISSLPLLEKDEIRNTPKALMNRKSLNQRLKTSGGSTGAPVTILKDSRGVAHEMAASWRGYHWAGICEGDKQVRFWGVPRSFRDKMRSKIIDLIGHRIRITAFGYNQKSMIKALTKIEKFDPDYFYGYTSIINDLAIYVLDNKITPKLNLKSIITTSEVLTEIDRKNIESAFSAKVFDEYGCGEVGTIAHQCDFGSMHINSENILVEVLDRQGVPVLPGQSGELVITDLTNQSMPLIRYRLKDFGTLSPQPCLCGRTLPVLEKIHGRQYDILTNSFGEKFHGEFFLYILEDARKKNLNAKGVQFIQNRNLDIIVKLMAGDKDYQDLKVYIEKRIREDFDRYIDISFELVNKIEREPSGKLRVVKFEP
ncbi:MAG: phenylacetate--CoA ligase family protein [Pseudomonadota bacterium]